MSVAAVAGPRVDLNGPRPVAPPHSLLKTPGVLQPEDTGRWLNGVNIVAAPTDLPIPWEECTEDTKAESGFTPQATFDPFALYLPVTCSAMWARDLRDLSEAALEARSSWGVEQVLVGAQLSTNPSFGDANVSKLAAGAAQTPQEALSWAENSLADFGQRGMIHASPATVAALQTDLLHVDGALETVNGTPVVSGQGYVGAQADGVSPGAGQDWMFVTGPVEVYLSEVTTFDLYESLDRSDNGLTFRAERWVVAYWDTAMQVAVLVQWAN